MIMEKAVIKGLRQNSIQCSGHTRPVVDLHFSGLRARNTYYMISASKDGVPMLRFGHTGDWIGSFKGHKGAVWSCTLTNDGSKAATGAADFTAKVWDCETGNTLSTISHGHIVRCVEFNKQADQLVTATNKYVIEIHDLKSSEKAALKFTGHTDIINRTLWFDDDKHVMSVSVDKSIRLWDLRMGREAWSKCTENMIYDMDIVGASMILACGKQVSLWSINPSEPEPIEMVRQFPTESNILSASLHPSLDTDIFPPDQMCSETFVCGGEDGLVHKYCIKEGTILDSCKAHFGSVHRVRYSPDGHLFASGSEDGTLRLWQNVLGETYGLWYLSTPEQVIQ